MVAGGVDNETGGKLPASEVNDMTTRDQYVQGLKKQLDVWNIDLDRWTAKAREAQAEVQERYRRELDVIVAQRELARYNLRLLESASNDAWAELRVGAEDAWDRMRLAAAAASTCFDPLPATEVEKTKTAKTATRKH
jgi:hypothetical protein